jgi:acetolactate synthase-1/2/3 large subunit
MLELDHLDGVAHRPAWREHLDGLRRRWPDTGELAGCDGINPNVLARRLAEASPRAAAFVMDVGQHAWWACQSIRPRAGQRIITAHGLGACGSGLPMAIGVAAKRRPVVAIAGDAAFQLNVQELQTVVRNRLPIKIVVVDNACHGSVRQFQERAFDGSYPSTVIGYDAPDFARVADAYGIPSAAVSTPEEVPEALDWMWRDPEAPVLLHVSVPTHLGVYPNLPFGSPIHAMERFDGASRPLAELA